MVVGALVDELVISEMPLLVPSLFPYLWRREFDFLFEVLA